MIGGVTEGMRATLASLRVYMTHFRGQRGACITAFGSRPGSRAERRHSGVLLRIADPAPGARARPRLGDDPGLRLRRRRRRDRRTRGAGVAGVDGGAVLGRRRMSAAGIDTAVALDDLWAAGNAPWTEVGPARR
jgi:hypothetical protein